MDESSVFAKDVRVAKVIDDRKLVLNIGQRDGVEIGDRFQVFEIGEEITDPVTQESLGNYELIKGTGEVFHVTEKLCLIESDMHRSMTGILAFQDYLSNESQRKNILPFENPKTKDGARKID